ncbi:MAG: VTT domain-containing protein [Clostridia bacterium]|nr:VTT domain-containing protein [Clostridia bacterium]
MNNKKRIKNIRIILTIFIVIIFAILVWKLIPFISDLSTTEGQILFKEKIESLGFKGILILLALQILQILLVVFPGEPFEVLAGMCYGTWGGCIFITASVFITTTVIVFTVRKLGKKYLYNFFQKERVDKIMRSKALKNPRNLEIILCLLFFLPGTPKDLFTYIGGLLPIKPLRFIIISTFVRFPSVITSTMVGSNISNGNWRISVLIYAITFVIATIIIYLVNLKDKNKEIINIIK